MPPWFDAEVATLARRTAHRSDLGNVILFYGSSTFTLWSDLEAHFPAHNAVNHGFGGSTLADCLEYFDLLVTPLKPRAVILYAGDNDLDNGASPERVVELLGAFLARKREMLGYGVPLAYVSIKVSIARAHFMHKIGYTNRIAEHRLAAEPDAAFVDFTRRLVGRGVEPWRACFTHDPLHMNAKGYRILGRTIAEHIAAIEGKIGSLKVREPTSPPAWADAGTEPGGGGLVPMVAAAS